MKKLFEQKNNTIKKGHKKIIWIAYKRGKIFQRFKQKEKFATMIKDFGVRKSTITFKIRIDIFKIIKEICKGNASEFKQVTKICLKLTSLFFTHFT